MTWTYSANKSAWHVLKLVVELQALTIPIDEQN